MRSFLGRALGVTVALLVAAAAAVPVWAATLEVGPDKTYKQPSEAIAKAHDGDTVLIAAGQYFDCAIVRVPNLTIAGSAPDGGAVLTDKTCGGKGILVTDAKDVTVRNLTLTRARVPDGNGAGIRAEGVNLTVDQVRFINNQNGILGNAVPDSTITVRNSRFERNGTCDRACAHGIYVGHIKLLRIENSVFTATKQGHHIKSRAARTEVIGCDISDGPEGTASYEIDVPNGGALVARNNRMQKGPKAENHSAVIILGEEGVTQPTPEIVVENNTFRNDGEFTTIFVVNDTATEAMLKGNKLSGQVKPLRGDGSVQP
jgi:hypothetical protein